MYKVAYVIPDLETRGMPRVLENISNNMDETVLQTTICLKKKDIRFNVRGEVISLDEEGRNLIDKIIFFIRKLVRLNYIIRKNKYDVVIGFGMTANLMIILSRIKSVKIITEHNVKSIENFVKGSAEKNIYNYIYDSLMKLLYKYADKIVAVSKVIAIDLNENYNVPEGKIRVIYNGVHKETIRRMAKQEIHDNYDSFLGKPMIINVGALSYQKGQWYLIEVMRKVVKKMPEVQLIILGEGEKKDELAAMIERYKLHDNVHLLGFKKNPYQFICKADAFVLSSLYEGFPNVLVEAMMLDIPIISTDCKSGPRELLSDKEIENLNEVEYAEYGILTPDIKNRSAKELEASKKIYADAIVKMIVDKKLKEKFKKKSAFRSKKFSAEQMAREYFCLIRESVES